MREFNKRSRHFLFGDHLLILITVSLDNLWISLGENCCWSLLGLKGLKYEHSLDVPDSVRSRRLEVWAQEKTGAREGDTQEETEGEGVPSLARPFFHAPTTSKRLLGRLGP